jgi:predicted membrane protein
MQAPEETLNPSTAIRIAPRLLVGIGILALGLLWTLDNMDLIESERITEWWPMILIAIGLVRFLDPVKSKIASILFIVVGLVLLIDNLDVANVDLGDLIPLGIAAIGAKLIWDAVQRRSYTPTPSTSDDGSTMSAFALWAGVRRQSISQAFRGGDASAVMGGVELDLRHAQIRDGEQAVIDAFAMWGGVEITVPENWRVVSKVMPLMGGFEDKTTSKNTTGPVLIVQGTAIMGAIEVKN